MKKGNKENKFLYSIKKIIEKYDETVMEKNYKHIFFFKIRLVNGSNLINFKTIQKNKKFYFFVQ